MILRELSNKIYDIKNDIEHGKGSTRKERKSLVRDLHTIQQMIKNINDQLRWNGLKAENDETQK